MFLVILWVHPLRAEVVDTRRLMSAVEQWVELQDTIHREQAEWKQQSESLRHHLSLLQREHDQLTARIAAAKEEMDEQTAAEWEEQQLLTSLQQSLSEAATLLSSTPRESTTEQLGPLLDQTVRAHRDHRGIHTDRARMTTPSGQKVLMQTLQLGTTQAYAVSPDDQYAAHGVWDDSAWQWQWNPDWASSIRTALRIAAGERPPRWVPLPVKMLETPE